MGSLAATALGREARMPKQIVNSSPGFLGQPSSKWQDPVALVRRRLSRPGMKTLERGPAGGVQLHVLVLLRARRPWQRHLPCNHHQNNRRESAQR